MKASELRIGNLINGYSSIRGLNPFPIKAGNISQLQDEINGFFNKDCPRMIDNIRPITITEEWLVKLGFVKSPAFYAIDLYGGYILYLDNKIYLSYGDHGNNEVGYIKYVHQLQNLYFALTGEELIIN
jgi:hypothetical protein